MTYENDPSRWSDPQNADAPDVLRDLMKAGANDLPSAARLAALGAKVSATAGGGAAVAGTLGTAKLWVAGLGISAALLGGGLMLYTQGESPQSRSQVAGVERSTSTEASPSAAPTGESRTQKPRREPAAPTAEDGLAAPAGTAPFVEAMAEREPAAAGSAPEASPTAETATAAEPSVDAIRGELDKPSSAAHNRRQASSASGPRARAAAPTPSRLARPQKQVEAAGPSEPGESASDSQRQDSTAVEQASGSGQVSELSLLLEARRALSKSPRRALSLASKHASQFPDSQFAQERDAVVIEALTRNGQLDRARDEARRFVRRYPDSAHAHRFRERLDLR